MATQKYIPGLGMVTTYDDVKVEKSAPPAQPLPEYPMNYVTDQFGTNMTPVVKAAPKALPTEKMPSTKDTLKDSDSDIVELDERVKGVVKEGDAPESIKDEAGKNRKQLKEGDAKDVKDSITDPIKDALVKAIVEQAEKSKAKKASEEVEPVAEEDETEVEEAETPEEEAAEDEELPNEKGLAVGDKVYVPQLRATGTVKSIHVSQPIEKSVVAVMCAGKVSNLYISDVMPA